MSNQTIKNKYDVVIVGSGFSGTVAAGILADHQLDVLMVDENPHVGGQLLRKIPDDLGENTDYHPDYVKKIGFRFVENVKQKKIRILSRTCIMGIYPDNRLLMEIDAKEVHEVRYDVLLFATGARERFLPFKGWTLPGVYSGGMVQVLMKSSGVLPAKNILIAGRGLFLFSVGSEFLKNKGKVLAILEQSGMMDKLQMIPVLFHQLSKAVEGARYMSKFFFSGVPVKYRKKVLEARGKRYLEDVVVGKVDSDGKPISGSEKIYKTNALAIGYGFVPNIEAPQMAGCELVYADDMGGWIVKVNDYLETSVENILAAGEITGVGGGLKSINEGKIAANTILKKFEKIDDTEYQRQFKKLHQAQKYHHQFAHFFNSLYRVPLNSILDIPAETIICRCEDITMGKIKKAVANGYNTPKGLKNAMRVTMGNCQGRTCSPVIYDILNVLTHHHPQTIGLFQPRSPLKPISIAALADFCEKKES